MRLLLTNKMYGGIMRTILALHPPTLVGGLSIYLASINPVFYILTVVMVLDIIARYKEYKELRDSGNHKHRIAMLKHMSTSWCTRTAAKWAYPPARYYYKQRGYRYYHLLPDRFHKRILTLRFWKGLTGVCYVK